MISESKSEYRKDQRYILIRTGVKRNEIPVSFDRRMDQLAESEKDKTRRCACQ
jgi:hypothetical protein